MLLNRATLDRIAAGEVSLVFRRWKKPTVRAGGTLRTAIGVLAIDSVEVTTLTAIVNNDARRAGYESAAALVKELKRYPDGDLYRIEFHLAGPDPRIALREQAEIAPHELAAIQARLHQLDSGKAGPWTNRFLRLIAKHPALPAGELAERINVEKEWLKVNVRKLKELGLTESLTPGYRLSPRGRTFLSRQ